MLFISIVKHGDPVDVYITRAVFHRIEGPHRLYRSPSQSSSPFGRDLTLKH